MSSLDVNVMLASFAAGDGIQVCSEVRNSVAVAILDTVGCMLAGHSETVARCLLRSTASEVRPGSAAVVGTARRYRTSDAALLNHTLAHAWEMDDFDDAGVVHGTAACLSAAIAVGNVDGEVELDRLMVAVAVGREVICRLGRSMSDALSKGFHPALLCGFGAAATSGYLYRLSPTQMLDTFGIVAAGASGSVQTIHDGIGAKRLQPALNTRVGVEAAILIKNGFPGGSRRPFDGKSGVLSLYSDRDQRRQVDEILRGLGQTWVSQDLSPKLYPNSRCCHAAIDALSSLRHEEAMQLEDIGSVTVSCGRMCAHLEGQALEGEGSEVAAQFSLPYAIAATLMFGDFRPSVLAPNVLRDVLQSGLMKKVFVEVAAHREAQDMGAEVTVCLRDGTMLSRTVDKLRGSVGVRLTENEIRKRFFANAETGGFSTDSPYLDRLVDLLTHLSTCSFNEFIDAITGSYHARR